MPFDFFPLRIFPEGGLSSSVIVTVWIGIAVVATTNLRLGWVLSGLVVPGYMVPLLIAKPAAAAVVFAEGIITYGLVWFYSEYLTRFTGWSNFFGRDRFFALVLASVLVRIVSDAVVLPEIGQWLQTSFEIAFDYRSNLHSFGLIVISLIANNFWKTGLRGGIWPMAVQVGVTWLIVLYVLVPFTNFNVASLGFMYEDIAVSLLATPKAYIILLVTAFIASRMNLFYGWDFSGILIPSLLALQWYQPMKIVTTIVESVVILGLSILVLQLPLYRGVTVEGGRKLLLFFNISFVYKLALGWALVFLAPGLRISDWFGFGYLLPTLIAMKIHDKGIFARMTRATLQTSLVGVAVATVIGFILLLIPDPQWHGTTSANAQTLAPIQERSATDIVSILQQEKTGFYAAVVGNRAAPPLPREADAFAYGIRLLLEYRRNPDPDALSVARSSLHAANYVVEHAGDYLILRERQPAKGWGAYVLRLGDRTDLVVEVPAPLDEPGSFEAGAAVFMQSKANAYASAGSLRMANKEGLSDVLVMPQSIFQMFHRELAMRDVLQIRTGRTSDPVLYVSGDLSAELPLQNLESTLGEVKVNFFASPERNLQRQTAAGSFAELLLSRTDAVQLSAAIDGGHVPPRQTLERSIGALMLERMNVKAVAAPGSDVYGAPTLAELLRLDREVLTPLLALARMQLPGQPLDAAATASLRAISAAADLLDFDLFWFAGPRHDHFMLADRNRHRGWITVRTGAARNLVLEVPRPHADAGTLEAAVALYDSMNPRMLIAAGATPGANRDGTADVLAPSNAATVYTLAHQVALREMGALPGAAVAVRAFGVRPDQPAPREDALLVFDIAHQDRGALPEFEASLLRELENTGLEIRLGSGASDTAGYDASGGPQADYLNQTSDKRFAVLWLSPLNRRQLDRDAQLAQRRHFTALGLPAEEGDVVRILSARALAGGELPQRVRQQAEAYLANRDIVTLTALQKEHPRLRFERIDDESGRGSYLLVSRANGSLLGVMSLTTAQKRDASDQTAAPGPISADEASRFISSKTRWLRAG